MRLAREGSRWKPAVGAVPPRRDVHNSCAPLVLGGVCFYGGFMLHRSARRCASLVLVAVVSGFLAACSGGGEGVVSGNSARSVGSGQSEVRMSGGYRVAEDGRLLRPEKACEVPVLDAAANQFTAEGAELAARHFLRLTEYAWATGDTKPMRDFFDSRCSACAEMARDIEDLYSGGGWSDGVKYAVREVIQRVPVEELPGTFNIELYVKNAPYVTFNGERLVDHEGSSSDVIVFTTWDEPTWRVFDEGAVRVETEKE